MRDLFLRQARSQTRLSQNRPQAESKRVVGLCHVGKARHDLAAAPSTIVDMNPGSCSRCCLAHHTDTAAAVPTEDEVVAAVCDLLEANDYAIARRAKSTDRGLDIVAEGPRGRIVVEAKGEGSSRAGSRRYGEAFTSRQTRNHVGNALLKALRVVSKGDAVAAIALPDTRLHRHEVEQVRIAIERVGIGIFWVQTDTAEVTLDAPWSL